MLSLAGAAQLQNKNVFTQIQRVKFKDPKKITLIYSYLEWCGGNKDDVDSIKNILLAYRSRYNFILLTTRKAIKRNDLFVKKGIPTPDSTIIITDYYKDEISTMKEKKRFAKAFNIVFLQKEYLLGPALLIALDIEGRLKKIFSTEERKDELKRFLDN